MFHARLLAIVLCCAAPVPASAQAWAEAYRSGNYERAADLLHDIVIESTLRHAMDDPRPARHLAVLYARGVGVERDPIAACALAQFADMSAQNVFPPEGVPDPRKAYQLMRQENEQFVSDHCGLLTDAERLTASRAVGCFAFGMPEEEVTVGGQVVRIGRHGVSLANAKGVTDPYAVPLVGCPVAVAGVRVTSIVPPPDAAPDEAPRHFVEVLGWQRHHPDHPAQPRYTLIWTVHELRVTGILPVVLGARLEDADGWPRPGRRVDIATRRSMQMVRSGHVRWIVAGDPPMRGWIMMPADAGR